MNIIELTVPHEDNINTAHLWKDEHYEGLVKYCESSGWKVVDFHMEVGCRGFVSHIMKGWLLTLGLSNKKVNKVLKDIQETVEKASHWKMAEKK